jgi:hypothetical protein
MDWKEYNFGDCETFGMGKWVRFKCYLFAPRRYTKNLIELKKLIRETPWQEKERDRGFEGGDTYVFVGNDEKPHILIRLNHVHTERMEVAYIRGAEEDEYFEPGYEKVAYAFLRKNVNTLYNIDVAFDSLEWNNRLLKHIEKIESGIFTKDDVPKFTRDYMNTRYRKKMENRNRKKLTELLPKIKDKIAEYYNCSVDEIFFGDLNLHNMPNREIPDGIKVIYGRFLARPTMREVDMKDVKIIVSDVELALSGVFSLKNVEYIGGNAYFGSSMLGDLGNLRCIGGSAYFKDSYVRSLKNLKEIFGDLDVYDSKVEDLGDLEIVHGDATFNSKIKEFKNLKFIGGNAKFNTCYEIESLGSVERVGGFADLPEHVKDLGNLEYVGGTLDATYSVDAFMGDKPNIGKLRHVGKLGSFFLHNLIGKYFDENGDRIEEKTNNK